ncbi:UNVERIFIED_CONTAM: Matrix remodeling-associated protein 8 [Gekko kuhli]
MPTFVLDPFPRAVFSQADFAALPWRLGCGLLAVQIDPNAGRGHNVINVIIPESRAHFFQQLGYILATLLLFILLLILVVLVTRTRRRRSFEYNMKKCDQKDMNLREFTADTTDLSSYKSEDIKLDYKNNILKEKAEHSNRFPAKNIDLDKGEDCRWRWG